MDNGILCNLFKGYEIDVSSEKCDIGTYRWPSWTAGAFRIEFLGGEGALRDTGARKWRVWLSSAPKFQPRSRWRECRNPPGPRGFPSRSFSTRSNRSSAVILTLVYCEGNKWRIWASVEYVKWKVEQERSEIVSNAIVYTDKSNYRSRVCILSPFHFYPLTAVLV